jgi:uncharacterized protein (DUF2267 family)
VPRLKENIMPMSKIDTIDHTVQLTNEWLNQLSERLDWDDPHKSYRLLRVALQALRDWLPMDEAVHLGAQMPILLRGLYYEGWHPAKTPVKERDLDAFLARVGSMFANDPDIDIAHAVAAVFWLLDTRVSEGEVEDVRNALPAKLRGLWVH